MAQSSDLNNDRDYLRHVQYNDGSRLSRRANLHAKYGSNQMPFFDWVGERLDLFEGADVLEVGCGTGWLWHESTFEVPPGTRLTLTDLSPGMAGEALSSIEDSRRVDSVAGHVADLQHLPFRDASFDRVIANHMLYHLPDPARGVAELARVVRPDGMVMAAANGLRHLRELAQIRADVFGGPSHDRMPEVFGPDNGFALFRAHFIEIRWYEYPDQLLCTDPADVLSHICSSPPAEGASADQLRRLTDAVTLAFETGGGQLSITKDVGCFIATGTRI